MEDKTTKNNITELVFILDRSGSMAGLEPDTIGGYNATIEKQKQHNGKVLVSTVLFSNEAEFIHDRVDIREINPMTNKEYSVGGCTALLDAIGNTIHHIVNIHRYARPEDIPEHTIFVITTDGMENASQEYTAEVVRSMVKHEEEKYGWEFLFLAANIDAVETATRYGIRRNHSAQYKTNPSSIDRMYMCVLRAINDVEDDAELSADWNLPLREDDSENGDNSQS